MTRDVRKSELARLLDVSLRTVERWVQQGCPATKGKRGRLLFNLDEVRAWLASLSGPSPEALQVPFQGTPQGHPRRPPEGVVISTIEKAELAGKIARARKAELEVAQEKHLRDLGLGTRIREAHTFEGLSQLTAEVAAACAEGDLRPERANALHRLIVERRRQLTKLDQDRADDPLGDRVLLCTAEAEDLVRAFEGLYSEARRETLLRVARELLEADLAETPPTDTGPGGTPLASAEPSPAEGPPVEVSPAAEGEP